MVTRLKHFLGVQFGIKCNHVVLCTVWSEYLLISVDNNNNKKIGKWTMQDRFSTPTSVRKYRTSICWHDFLRVAVVPWSGRLASYWTRLKNMFLKFSSIRKVTFNNTIEDFELNISQVIDNLTQTFWSRKNWDFKAEFVFIHFKREREIVKVQTNGDALTYLPLPPVIHHRISDRKK